MKSSIIAMSVAALLAFGTVSATITPAKKAPTAQQHKMGDCAKANKGKKGSDYKNSVSSCMKKGGTTAAAPAAPAAVAPVKTVAPATKMATAATSQQSKMKSCNADAGKQKLAGPARKTFMSSCLKKS